MKKIAMVVLVIFAFGCVPSAGWAASPWTHKATYQDKMVGKLGFGLKNLLLGWTELIKEPIHHFQKAEHNRLGHGMIGLGEGLVNAIDETIGGAVHLVTFPVVSLDVPLPHDGVQCQCPFRHCPMKK